MSTPPTRRIAPSRPTSLVDRARRGSTAIEALLLLFVAATLPGSAGAQETRAFVDRIGAEAVTVDGCTVHFRTWGASTRIAEPIATPCSSARTEGVLVGSESDYVVSIEEPNAWYPHVRFESSHGNRAVLRRYSVVGRSLRLQAPDGEPLAAESAEVDAEIVLKGGELLRGPVSCEPFGSELHCQLPSTRATFRIEIEGRVPAYLVEVEPGELPRQVTLPRGASLSAWVTLPATAQEEDLLAKLVPDLPARTAWLGSRPLAIDSWRGTDTVRGDRESLFQAGPLDPGIYDLHVATRGGARQLLPRIPVSEDVEVRTGPIALDGPLEVELAVTPREPPGGGVLGVRLESEFFDRDGNPWEPVSFETELDEGRGRIDAVPPGRYRLRIAGDSGVYFNEVVEISPSSTRIEAHLDLVELTGTISCGGEAYPGTVVFGGRASLQQIPMTADEEGMFHGWIPRGGSPWRIDVRPAGDTRSHHDILPVDIDDAGAFAQVALDLPGTSLTVRVEDLAGRPEARAFVHLIRVSEAPRMPSVWQSRTDEDGKARATCLEYGAYRVSANSREGESDVRLVEVDDEEPLEVTLRIEREVLVTGRILTDGVPAAEVELSVRGVVPGETFPRWSRGRSRPDGSTLFRERPGPVDLLLSKPGFPFHLRRLEVAEGAADFELSIGSVGGTVQFDPPMNRRDLRILRSRGIEVPFGLLYSNLSRTRAPRAPGPLRDAAPSLEPGPYEVCPEMGADSGRCLGFQVVAGQDGVVSTYLLEDPEAP